MDNRELSDMVLQSQQDSDDLFQRFMGDWLAKDIDLMRKTILAMDPQVIEMLRQMAPEQMAELEGG